MESWGGHMYMITVSEIPTCSKNMFQITLGWAKTPFHVREILRSDFYFSQSDHGRIVTIAQPFIVFLQFWIGCVRTKWSYYWSNWLISNHRYKPLKRNTNFFLSERASERKHVAWRLIWLSESIFSFFANYSVSSAWEIRLVSLVITSVLESPFYIKNLSLTKCVRAEIYLSPVHLRDSLCEK